MYATIKSQVLFQTTEIRGLPEPEQADPYIYLNNSHCIINFHNYLKVIAK